MIEWKVPRDHRIQQSFEEEWGWVGSEEKRINEWLHTNYPGAVDIVLNESVVYDMTEITFLFMSEEDLFMFLLSVG